MTEITRFYDTFHPAHYDIYLDINRGTKTFSGTTKINGDAKTKIISIHQNGLEIDSVEADDQVVPFKVDNKNDGINITLEKTGETTLAITYKAKLTDSMMGIYPSYYEVNGEKKQIIGTQFETNFASPIIPSCIC